jgi:hypothetical protein
MDVLLNRTCGNCTACCKTHAVSEINKPAGKWCPHCDIWKGCRIYPDRPMGCKTFKCEWLKGFGKESHRPDHTKIVLDFFTGGMLPKLLQIWKVGNGKIVESFIKKIALFGLAYGISVAIIHLSGEKELALSFDAEISDEMKLALSREKISLISPSELSVE